MHLKLKKGFDIKLVGSAKNNLVDNLKPSTFSFKPTSFRGISRPKITVNEGDMVKAGTPIFFDKWNPDVQFTAPVSGKVLEIRRGEKRKPLEIRIAADDQITYESFPAYSESELIKVDKEAVKEQLLKSGVWANITERPYGVVPKPDHTPKAIFISGFDSHPLAPDYEFVFQGEEKYLQAGINALKKLTSGKIHLSVKANSSSLFKSLSGVEFHDVSGPHPAGNVGVQIHHIDPINKGDIVWTVTPYGLQQIGRLFLEGHYDASKIIAVVGSEVSTPQYYKTITGAAIEPFVKDNLKNDHVRFVAGNVLTGERVELDGVLGFHDTMLTVLPEGDHHEFLGWILPSAKKLSFHRAFGLFSFLSPQKERVLDTNMHGEERAFVQTGVFEQVMPMDIYPIFLFKAILANDYENMEALGIYELIEEDIALCEFVDVSKMELQEILREGIEALQTA